MTFPIPVGGDKLIFEPAVICITPVFCRLTNPIPVAGGNKASPAVTPIWVTATFDNPRIVEEIFASKNVVLTKLLVEETNPYVPKPATVEAS